MAENRFSEDNSLLLKWLHPDSKTAGEFLVEIQKDIIKVLLKRGCQYPEDCFQEVVLAISNTLANKSHAQPEREAINLLTRDSSDYFDENAGLDKTRKQRFAVFYGYANNIEKQCKERRMRFVDFIDKFPPPLTIQPPPQQDLLADESETLLKNCLHKCINKLKFTETQKLLVFECIAMEEKITKEEREKLAEKLNIRIGNLNVLAHRVKKRLQQCLGDCKQNPQIFQEYERQTGNRL